MKTFRQARGLCAAALLTLSLPALAGSGGIISSTAQAHAPSLMLQSALQILGQERRSDLQQHLRVDRQRLWAAAREATRTPQAPMLAGPSAGPAVRSAP
jgi:hypothetical protein